MGYYLKKVQPAGPAPSVEKIGGISGSDFQLMISPFPNKVKLYF